MTDITENNDKSLGGLREAYIDVIARIVPGAGLFILYLLPYLIGLDSTAKFFLGIVFSYVAGFLLDVFGYACELVLSRYFGYFSTFDRTNWIRSLPGYDRRVALKVAAEEVLFRSLFFLGLFNLLYPTSFSSAVESFLGGQCSSFVLVLGSFIGHAKSKQFLKNWMDFEVKRGKYVIMDCGKSLC